MSTIVTRAGKGSPLTWNEVDNNFTNLNNDKYQSGSTASLAGLTLSTALTVGNGGTGATTLTGYLKGNGTSAFTASSTIPNTDITGLGTMSTQADSSVAITGGTINGTTIGGSTPADGTFTSLSDSGNLTFTGTGNRITGDFSNATFASRVAFQSSTTNGSTNIAAIPNGSGTTSAFRFYNTSDLTNYAALNILALSTEVSIRSITGGTGTAVPMTFITNGSERMRIDTSGNVSIAAGNLTFSSTGQRITGDFSNATIANRVALQTSTANSFTIVNTLPSGTGNSSGFNLFNNSDPTNSGRFILSMSNTRASIESGITGTGTYLPMTFTTNGSEAMRIDTSGNVGIGTSSPTGRFEISSDANSAQQVYIRNINAGSSAYSILNVGNDSSATAFRMLVASSTATAFGGADSANLVNSRNSPMTFWTNNTERMRIDSSGNVGIGTAGPSYKLDVVGASAGGAIWQRIYNTDATAGSVGGLLVSANGTNNYAALYNAVGGTTYLNAAGAGGMAIVVSQAQPMTFSTNGSERMRIDSSGNVGIGTAGPSTYTAKLATIRASGKANGVALWLEAGDNSGSVIDNVALILNDSSSGSAGGNSLIFRQTNAAGAPRRYAGIWGLTALSGSGGNLIFGTINSDNDTTGPTERMRIDSAGKVGIGVSSPTSLLTLAAGTATVAPLELTSGTNLTTPEAGAVEYDGTVMTATSNTSFNRGTIPLTNYASGTGTALGTNTEATLAVLLPAANDRITLPIGTYFLEVSYIVTRGATSTTSATSRLNILGSGTAAGSFSGMAYSTPTSGGTMGLFTFDGVNINVSNVLTAASTTAAGVYVMTLRGVLKITTAGTIVPQYNLSANINAAGTVSKVYYFRLQQLDSQSAATAGPAGTGWA